MSGRLAHAKINLALVVGSLLPGGKHEVTTVLQRIELADRVELEPAETTVVEGFPGDTIVRRALELVGGAWRARIDKQIPVAAGLGGGSSDAAAALALANDTVGLLPEHLHELAAALGADVPFFLAEGPQLGEGDGSTLTSVHLPQSYTVVLALPHDEEKASTASVYGAFDRHNGAAGYEERRTRLLAALAEGDLAALPPNDLASSPLAEELRGLGAFRADVSGAGPAVYGLFADATEAAAAASRLDARAWVWAGPPAW